MIRPDDIDTSHSFTGSGFGNFEREVIARNIVVVTQIIDGGKTNKGIWHPFTLAEYAGVRNATSNNEEFSFKEETVIENMIRDGHLTRDAGQQIAVAASFLEVVSEFSITQ